MLEAQGLCDSRPLLQDIVRLPQWDAKQVLVVVRERHARYVEICPEGEVTVGYQDSGSSYIIQGIEAWHCWKNTQYEWFIESMACCNTSGCAAGTTDRPQMPIHSTFFGMPSQLDCG